jgi:hypothetical protein
MIASIKTGIDFGKATVTQQKAIASLLPRPWAHASESSCPQPETTDDPNVLGESSF